MGVFDMAQSVVAQAAGIIGSDASIDISSVMADMETRLMDMDLGPLIRPVVHSRSCDRHYHVGAVYLYLYRDLWPYD